MAPSVGARIQRHNTAMASGTQIHGNTYSVRNDAATGQVAGQERADGQPEHGLDRHHDRHERTCDQQ